MKKTASTTPDPEFDVAFDPEMTKGNAPAKGDKNCPKDNLQAQTPQTPGGGGAPGTGQATPQESQKIVNAGQEDG